MKKTKWLLLGLCVAAVLTASVMGTLAYLTDEAGAVNTFTVGQVNIILDEEKVTENGQPTPEEDARVTENSYHLLPGQTYTKDPTVTVVAGSEAAYIRMIVTISCYDALQTIYEGTFLPQNFVGETWDGEKWQTTNQVTVSEDGKSASYEFRYYTAVGGYDENGNAADVTLPALFTQFTVPGEFDNEDMAAISGMQITVTGHAIQAAGFDTADAAWAAFDAQVAQ